MARNRSDGEAVDLQGKMLAVRTMTTRLELYAGEVLFDASAGNERDNASQLIMKSLDDCYRDLIKLAKNVSPAIHRVCKTGYHEVSGECVPDDPLPPGA